METQASMHFVHRARQRRARALAVRQCSSLSRAGSKRPHSSSHEVSDVRWPSRPRCSLQQRQRRRQPARAISAPGRRRALHWRHRAPPCVRSRREHSCGHSSHERRLTRGEWDTTLRQLPANRSHKQLRYCTPSEKTRDYFFEIPLLEIYFNENAQYHIKYFGKYSYQILN